MSRRTERVESLLKATISEIVCYELNDPRVQVMPTITRIEVSADLRQAKVFVSPIGSAGKQRACLKALQHAAGRIRHMVLQRVRMRFCPDLQFRLDESIKRTFETMRLIDQAMAEYHSRHDSEPEPPAEEQVDEEL